MTNRSEGRLENHQSGPPPDLSWKDCLATVLAFATAAGPVMAQPGAGTNAPIEGSDYASNEQLQPVAVITREDIETSGLTTLDELISDRSNYNDFGLYRPLSLGYRILVNGRYPAGALDLLPLSAVEHIEILNNNTATLNDGVADPGTINIVLRRDYEGFEVAALGGLPQASSGATGQASLLWGGGVGSGHLVVGVDSLHKGEIPGADRDYSRAKWSTGGHFADTAGVSVGGNTVFFRDRDDEDRTVVRARALGPCPPSLGYTGVLSNPAGASGEGCGFAYGNIWWNTERFKGKGVFTNFDYPLGDAASLYIDGRLAWADTTFRYAPSVGRFTIENPSEELLEAVGLDPDDGRTLTVSHRFVGHGNRDWTTDINEHDVTVGFQGKLKDNVRWDLSVNRYRHEEQETGNTFVSEDLAIEAIKKREYDLMNPRSTDPDHQAAIRRMALSMDRDEVVDITTVKAALQGTGFSLPGGNLQWTFGFEVENREEKDIMKHKDSDGKIYPLEDVLGSGGISYEGRRSRKSGFAEVQFPPLPDWTILLAAQLDDHDDVESTHALTVASTWRVNDMVMLHGSYQKGSSPPSLSDLHSMDAVTYPDICDTKIYTGPLTACDQTQIKTIYGSNSDLKPSKSKTWSLGGTAELGHLSLAAGWFRVESSDLPAWTAAQSIVDMEAQQGSSTLVTRQGGVITEIQNPLVNTGESRVSGFSLSGHADWNTDIVDPGLDVHWAYITESEYKVDGMVQPGDFPRHRVHATLRMSRGNVTAGWHTRTISGYDNNLGTGKFDPWVGHDLTLELRDVFDMEGLALQGGVLNLTNRGPSVDSGDPGNADTRLDSIRGRTFFLRAKLSW
ncbi:MAG: TonB-dependent receptor [Synechococcus sp. SB0670_bin_20]|nr:TonB-dependent receptor [Synechococcus sp. SB0670_bin_20]